MLIALLSDIHANSFALNATLDCIKKRVGVVDSYWVLGDVLGRGPFPLPAWRILETLKPDIWLSGNHDWYIALNDANDLASGTKLPGPIFRIDPISGEQEQVKGPNTSAWEVAGKHRDVLPTEVLAQLAELPNRAVINNYLYLAHAAFCSTVPLSDAEIWLEYYIDSPTESESVYTAPEAPWRYLPADFPILHIGGHTHRPKVWERVHGDIEETAFSAWKTYEPGKEIAFGEPFPLNAGFFYCLNPGSVGMPYTQVCYPNFAILDLSQMHVTFYQADDCGYDIEVVRSKMKQLGYPKDLYTEAQMKPCP